MLRIDSEEERLADFLHLMDQVQFDVTERN
jgi:hypothetical protein